LIVVRALSFPVFIVRIGVSFNLLRRFLYLHIQLSHKRWAFICACTKGHRSWDIAVNKLTGILGRR